MSEEIKSQIPTTALPAHAEPDHDDHDHNHDHDDHTPAMKVELAEHDHEHDDHDDHKHDDHDDHEHDDHDDHEHGGNFFSRLLGGVVHTHSHGDGEDVGRYMEESERGIQALKISLVGLAITASFQLVIAIYSASAGLLADTIHNFSDALTAIPLWIAFVLGQRQATRRYTYGYGRAEDLAGMFVVLMIIISAIISFYESLDKLLHPQPITGLGWVAAAAIVGFIGNEGVAVFRIRVGKEIGSAALVADGQHARVDGLTSLAVLFGALGVWLGFPQADPIVGILITIAIALVLKNATLTVYRRMMDAIDPELLDKIELLAAKTKGVEKVADVRGRWLGHQLYTELSVEVDGSLSTSASHAVGEEVRHTLLHKIPRLGDIIIHVDPAGTEDSHHEMTAHHKVSRLPAKNE